MPAEIFKSTCSYCGVGCGIQISKARDGTLSLSGDVDHPANKGMLCAKGRTLLHVVRAREARLTKPVMRISRGAPRSAVSWDHAIGHVAEKFKAIRDTHGPDAVAFYVSGQCLTEEYYLANKIARGFLGTNNIDSNSRLCMSSAVAGYQKTLGADGPPTSYDDIELADTFLVAGANPAWCHPILFRRMEARKAAAPHVKLVVIDPRKTATAAVADLHLQILPGTDVALFHALARELVRTGNVDAGFIADHTEGWDAFRGSIEPFTPEQAATLCGVPAEQIRTAARYLSGDRKFLSMWTMGLNQSAVGTDKNIALIQLSLITGKIGKPGCGPFSLTGQPNAMGGREVGGMATLLPAHRDAKLPAHRQAVADFWGVPSLPDRPGLTAVEMFDALHAGAIKAVWVVATNPVASLPHGARAEAALAKAELVVVQDIYPTETTDLADVILPAAGWLEKTGTMTNSDRRIALLEKAIDPPGGALADTDILLKFAHAMGWGRAFNYPTVADIFAEHAALTAGTDVDITGLSHETLRARGPTQWPAPRDATSLGTPRLYASHHFPTPTGRARLHAVPFTHRGEKISDAFPLVLTTGRIRDQWHTMTKTGRVNKLNQHLPSPFCEMHPDDAVAAGVSDGDVVTVTSSRGQVRVPAAVTDAIRPGVVFLPMHWGKKLGGELGRTNNVTSPALDPTSKEPDFKFAAVAVEKFAPPRRRVVVVGAGAAALAFVERHRSFNARDEVHVFGAEPRPFYDRVLLPHYIAGEKTFDQLHRSTAEGLRELDVRLHAGRAIVSIDRTNKTVSDDAGRVHPYDVLVLATGSRPTLPVPHDPPAAGVFTLRSVADADAIMHASGTARHVVINGGGLLGLELAAAMQARGHDVTVVNRSERLMSKQLDAVAADHLAETLRDRGINLALGDRVDAMLGSPALTGVRLRARGDVPCDLLVFATGVTANSELARAAGLPCDRGICVNVHLQTADASIFAIGECAQVDGQTVGTTPGAEAHAVALAEFLRGNTHAPYRHRVSANILKIPGLQLAATGMAEAEADAEIETVLLHDPRRRFYQKCLVKNDRLVGCVLLGDTSRFAEYLELIQNGTELEDRRDTLLRPGAAGATLDGPLVCSCNNVGANTIRHAITNLGPNLHAVCNRSRAGTSCGSCRPEVQRLINLHAAASQVAHTAGA